MTSVPVESTFSLNNATQILNLTTKESRCMDKDKHVIG